MLLRYSVVRLPKRAAAGRGVAAPNAPPNIIAQVATAATRPSHLAGWRSLSDRKLARELLGSICSLLSMLMVDGPDSTQPVLLVLGARPDVRVVNFLLADGDEADSVAGAEQAIAPVVQPDLIEREGNHLQVD